MDVDRLCSAPVTKESEQTASSSFGTLRRGERQKQASGNDRVRNTLSFSPSTPGNSHGGTLRLQKQSTVNGPASPSGTLVNGDSQPFRWSTEFRATNANSNVLSASFYEGMPSASAGPSPSAFSPLKWSATDTDDESAGTLVSSPTVTFRNVSFISVQVTIRWIRCRFRRRSFFRSLLHVYTCVCYFATKYFLFFWLFVLLTARCNRRLIVLIRFLPFVFVCLLPCVSHTFHLIGFSPISFSN